LSSLQVELVAADRRVWQGDASMVVPRLKPDIGRLIEAAVDMDTADMRFDSAELERRFPDSRLTRFAEVARRDLVRESVPV